MWWNTWHLPDFCRQFNGQHFVYGKLGISIYEYHTRFYTPETLLWWEWLKRWKLAEGKEGALNSKKMLPSIHDDFEDSHQWHMVNIFSGFEKYFKSNSEQTAACIVSKTSMGSNSVNCWNLWGRKENTYGTLPSPRAFRWNTDFPHSSVSHHATLFIPTSHSRLESTIETGMTTAM